MSAADAFLQTHDFLLGHRADYETAYRGFQWPQLDKYSWALDYFDPVAQGNSQPGLWVVEDGGSETKLSFAELSARSNQAANFLRAQGVQRGDRLPIMLPNVVPLREVRMAAMKLGAVMIPASTLLTTADLQDRIERGEMPKTISGKIRRVQLRGVENERQTTHARGERSSGKKTSWS